LNRKFTLNIEGKDIAAELFRKTNKALTVTGYTLDPAVRELSNIDKVFDWALVWGERRKAAAAEQTASSKGNGFDSSGCKYSIDDIEQIVGEGAPAGANRSDVFHSRRPLRGLWMGCGSHLRTPAGTPAGYWRPLSRRGSAAPRDRTQRREVCCQ